MTPAQLGILKGLLTQETGAAAILDAAWRPVWQNTKNAPDWNEALHLPEDHWENGIYPVVWEERLWDCALSCDKASGVRTAVLRENAVPDESVTAAAVETLRLSAGGLREVLHEHELLTEETRGLFAGISVSAVKLYLPQFCRRATIGMLRRQDDGSIQLPTFLETVDELLESALRQVARTSIRMTHKGLWANDTSVGALLTAILCGVVLTCPESERPHDIALDFSCEDGIGTLTIESRALPEPSQSPHASTFGAPTQEAALLALYCRHHGASWTCAEEEGAWVGRLSFPVTDYPLGRMLLYSGGDLRDRPFFNQYELLLARLIYRAYAG